MQSFRARIVIVFFLLHGFFTVCPFVSAAEEADVRTQEVVGKIISTDPESSSFDLEYVADEPGQQKRVLTFFVTDISTIDIAMTQGTLADLQPGLRVLVEFAAMTDGTNVVESVWVKK